MLEEHNAGALGGMEANCALCPSKADEFQNFPASLYSFYKEIILELILESTRCRFA